MSPEVQRKSKIKKLVLLNLLIWLLLLLLAMGNSLLIDTSTDTSTVAEIEVVQDEPEGQAVPASPLSEPEDKRVFVKRPADEKYLSVKSSDKVYTEPYSESFKRDIEDIGDIETPEGVQPVDSAAEKAATEDSPATETPSTEAPPGGPLSREAASAELKATSDDSGISTGTGVVVAGGTVSSGEGTGGGELPEGPGEELPQEPEEDEGIIDEIPPYVTIATPGESSTHYSYSIAITGEAGDDESGVQSVLVNGKKADYTSGIFNYTISGLDDGEHIITVVVQDAAGNSSEASVTITYIPTTEVFPEESIQGKMNDPESKEIIYIHEGTYEQDVNMKDGKILMGEDTSGTVIKGHIVFAETTATVKTLTIEFTEGDIVNFTSANNEYEEWKLLTDAGITAINSEITVEGCIIMPYPDEFGSNNYGKGIQIWNLYGTGDITPVIENNTISNTEDGIFLYSHQFGGAILGEIRGMNTLDSNTRGITLRMHKEKPLITENTISNNEQGIHITYEDGDLLTERMNKISNNEFLNNTDDIYCDEQ